MKKILKLTLILSAFFTVSTANAQYLPQSYEAILNEIVENFKTIRGATAINDGKTSLRLLAEDRIIIRMDHNRSVKTLTFTKAKDEEGQEYWVSDNSLTTDMVNKYEKDLTKVMEKMLDVSRKEAKI